MNSKNQDPRAKNAAIRYANGGAPEGPKVSLSCPKATADALRALSVSRRVAVSRLIDEAIKAYLASAR